jgi:hypothetical protein
MTHRDLLFAGTLSIAADTVLTSPLPSAETRISQGCDAPQEAVASDAIITAM